MKAQPKDALSESAASAVNAPAPHAFTPQMIRARIGKLCVAITGATPAEMLDRATDAARENNFLEFRLDYLSSP
ncbi:MAG TPA: hypothetical protein VFL96_17280, partial [Acidobacteriaceae bacterium]|nr:hypothetical protein [Acidobacteriaceae bacterium]